MPSCCQSAIAYSLHRRTDRNLSEVLDTSNHMLLAREDLIATNICSYFIKYSRYNIRYRICEKYREEFIWSKVENNEKNILKKINTIDILSF